MGLRVVDNIKELVAQLKLFCKLDIAFGEKLEELETSVYALQQDNKLLKGEVKSLQKRYSELLYKLNSLAKDGGI